MNTIKYVEILSALINNNNTISKETKEVLVEIKDLINRTFINRKHRQSPNTKLKVRFTDILRMRGSQKTKIILYIMQLNEEPVSFISLFDLVRKIDKKITKSLISSSIKSLITTNMITRSGYATYSLTEKGKSHVV